MQTVYLNGEIAKFGEKWQTSCNSVADIIKLIDCQTPGFRKHLINAAESGIDYQIMRGEEFLEEEELFMSLGKEDIIITELPAGAGKAGKIIAGTILVIAAVVASGGTAALTSLKAFGAAVKGMSFFQSTLALIGVSLVNTGISEMMMPGPEVDGTEQNKNFLFQGPVNTMTQGMPVPLAYGEMIVGGAPIAVSFSPTPIFISDPSNSSFTSNTTPTVDVDAGDTQNNTSDDDGGQDNDENDSDNAPVIDPLEETPEHA